MIETIVITAICTTVVVGIVSFIFSTISSRKSGYHARPNPDGSKPKVPSGGSNVHIPPQVGLSPCGGIGFCNPPTTPRPPPLKISKKALKSLGKWK